MNSEKPTSSVRMFCTEYIHELGGHALLISGCQKSVRKSYHQKAIREWVIIFPNDIPKIANRILSQVDDDDYPFFENIESESSRLLNIAKTGLLRHARKASYDMMEVSSAIKEGEIVTEEHLLEMHYLGLLGEDFYTLYRETKIGKLQSVSRKFDKLDRASHSDEPFATKDD